MKPCERFDLWWEDNAAKIEGIIIDNNYPRQWVYRQRGPMRAWIIKNTPGTTFRDAGWKRRLSNWLINGWYEYITEDQRREIRALEMGMERRVDRPPQV